MLLPVPTEGLGPVLAEGDRPAGRRRRRRRLRGRSRAAGYRPGRRREQPRSRAAGPRRVSWWRSQNSAMASPSSARRKLVGHHADQRDRQLGGQLGHSPGRLVGAEVGLDDQEQDVDVAGRAPAQVLGRCLEVEDGDGVAPRCRHRRAGRSPWRGPSTGNPRRRGRASPSSSPSRRRRPPARGGRPLESTGLTRPGPFSRRDTSDVGNGGLAAAPPGWRPGPPPHWDCCRRR